MKHTISIMKKYSHTTIPGPMVIPYLGSRPIFSVADVQAMHKVYGDIFK